MSPEPLGISQGHELQGGDEVGPRLDEERHQLVRVDEYTMQLMNLFVRSMWLKSS